MMCPKCGTQLSDDARFCNICGSPVEAANPWQTANDLGDSEPEPQENPYAYSQNSYAPNPDPQDSYAPSPYPQDSYAPNSYSAEGAAPKKSKKKLWFILGGAVVLAAVVAVVLILVLGGSTPTSVVEDYLESNLSGDFVAGAECMGLDYKEYMRILYEDDDIDDLVDSWLEERDWYDGDCRLEYECDEWDLDYSKWEKKLKKAKDIDDYIDFDIDFSKAQQEAYVDKYELSYEIKSIKEEELTSRHDVKAAERAVEDWFDEHDYLEDALLFDEDDINGYYLVTGKCSFENDGEKDTERFSMLVVDTSEGCFIIDTNWDPDD